MDPDMFRPPVNRLMRTLDRSFFQKSIRLRAARVFDVKNIGKVRSALTESKDIFNDNHVHLVQPDPDPARAQSGGKCVLLRPEYTEAERPTNGRPVDAPSSIIPRLHSNKLIELVEQGLIDVVPFTLKLEYKHWDYAEIIAAIMPEDEISEIPHSFSSVGHVAHLNLREHYLPYKHIIAQLILDKSPQIRTVINKVDHVGDASEYRTFSFELLAGENDLNVSTTFYDCKFEFDYSKVYWSSRLDNEHTRLVNLFKPGEAVCDVMAGIGPFALPAGKRRVFVWANDLNPECHKYLRQGIRTNKLEKFVTLFEADGHTFIPNAILSLAQSNKVVEIVEKPSRAVSRRAFREQTLRSQQVTQLRVPKTFDHFVMNLPATATHFLPSFIGAYNDDVRRALGDGPIKMPTIHVYCFILQRLGDGPDPPRVVAEVSKQLQYQFEEGPVEEGKVHVHEVRTVSTYKKMYCASFKLPEEIAFRKTQ